MVNFNLPNRTPIFHAFRFCAIENCQFIVAAALWPDVEGGRLAARKKPPELFDGLQLADGFWLGRMTLAAGRDATALRQARTAAATFTSCVRFRLFRSFPAKIPNNLAGILRSDIFRAW
jgi:hypothetical protein